MTRNIFITLIIFTTAFILTLGGPIMSYADPAQPLETIQLPDPSLDSPNSIEAMLAGRRSVRQYSDRALTLDEISQILWAGQGITNDRGFRTTPSAGALYPLSLYLVVENVDGLTDGVWEYNPEEHSVGLVVEGTLLADLSAAALDQSAVTDAAAVLVIAAWPEITRARYGDRTMRYVDQEVGCVCQSVYLQCESLGLGTVAMGAFYDDDVADILTTDASPRLLMPIGAVGE
jgi:SagB-type dehydrogenase family enzyme